MMCETPSVSDPPETRTERKTPSLTIPCCPPTKSPASAVTHTMGVRSSALGNAELVVFRCQALRPRRLPQDGQRTTEVVDVEEEIGCLRVGFDQGPELDVPK